MLTPVILFTISYVLGVLTGNAFHVSLFILMAAIIICMFCVFILLQEGHKTEHLVMFMIFLFGVLSIQFHSSIPRNDISRFADDRFVRIVGSVADEPTLTDDLTKMTLRVQGVIVRGVTYKTSGNVSLYIKGQKDRIIYGNRIQVAGKLSLISSTSNPGISSYADLMAKRNIRCQMFSSGSGVKILARSFGNPLIRLSVFIKNKLVSVIQNSSKEPYSSLLGSIIFGSQASPLSNELQDNYRTAGVIHLLVVSGTQVSIIASVILSFCKFAGLSRIAKLSAVTAVNVLFAVVVGAGSSIIRAVVMSEAALVANVFERETDFYSSLSLSAFILLVFDPRNLFDTGFQLSFVATWALFHVAPAIEEMLKNSVLKPVSAALSISIAPTIATTPIILYNFGQISFVSVLSNFVIVPWVEMTVILGFASTLIGIVFLPLAYVLNNVLTVILMILNGFVCFFAGLPYACRYFKPPHLAAITAYYIMFIYMVEIIKGRVNININFNKLKPALIISALLFSLLLFWGHSNAAQDLIVTAIDVGQGDSILIEAPSGRKVLIDGGGKQEIGSSTIPKEDQVGRSIVVPFLRKKGINEIDLLILTHPHDDHVGGLPYVLEKIKVDQVLDSGQPHTSRGYKKFLKLINDKHIPYRLARAGQVIDLGGGAKGYILHPSEPFIRGTISDLNNNSVVMRLVYGQTSFLFMGDTAFEGENRIMSLGYDLKSDVLKVGHHGSATSTSMSFLEAIRPEYAVISVGAKNKFGHPNPGTLERLETIGAKVYRTDLNGSVVFRSDGNRVRPQ
jgi:competence protein ComEC